MGLFRNKPSLRQRVSILEEQSVTQQEEIAAFVKELEEIKGNLATAKENVEKEFAELEKQIAEGTAPAQLDLTNLKAAITNLTEPTTELENIKPVANEPTNPVQQPTEPSAAQQEEAARASV
jgi:replication-associated recombination protein RarA